MPSPSRWPAEPVARAAYPKALQLPAGSHQLCGCLGSDAWPVCDGGREDCATRRHTLELKKPRFVWMCQCGTSGELPFCDGRGHLLLDDECGRAPSEAR